MKYDALSLRNGIFGAALLISCAAGLSPSLAQTGQSMDSVMPAAGATVGIGAMDKDALTIFAAKTKAAYGAPAQGGVAASASAPSNEGAGGGGTTSIKGNRTSASAYIDAVAHFVAGTSLTVNLVVGLDHSSDLRHAYVSVQSPPGETAVMTCGITSAVGGAHTRDCGGAHLVQSHPLLSNTAATGLMLTYDVNPASSAAPDRSISIEVSYI